MINEGKIYKITNLVNNKVYIGCTIKSLERRFMEHISRSKKRKYKSKLYNSIEKYGKDNFIIELLQVCETKDLYDLEIKFIKEFDSFNIGLNSTIGGEGCIGYKHTPEARIKCIENGKNVGDFRRGKTYEEIYGEEQAAEEKKKRSESTTQMWKNLPQDQNLNRRIKSMLTSIIKAGYTVEMILEIRQLHSNGMKPRNILTSFPSLTKQDITNILDKRHFKLINTLKEKENA
jgi:group I intron endonuclease